MNLQGFPGVAPYQQQFISQEHENFVESFSIYKKDFLREMSAVPQEEQENVICLAMRLCKYIKSSEERLLIVVEIVKINSKERNDVTDRVNKFFPQCYYASEIIVALRAIAGANSNERDDVIRRAMEIAHGNISVAMDCLREIVRIGLNERDDVTNFLKELPGTQLGWLQRCFLERICEIESKEQKNTIDQIKSLIAEKIKFPITEKNNDWELSIMRVFDKVIPNKAFFRPSRSPILDYSQRDIMDYTEAMESLLRMSSEESD